MGPLNSAETRIIILSATTTAVSLVFAYRNYLWSFLKNIFVRQDSSIKQLEGPNTSTSTETSSSTSKVSTTTPPGSELVTSVAIPAMGSSIKDNSSASLPSEKTNGSMTTGLATTVQSTQKVKDSVLLNEKASAAAALPDQAANASATSSTIDTEEEMLVTNFQIKRRIFKKIQDFKPKQLIVEHHELEVHPTETTTVIRLKKDTQTAEKVNNAASPTFENLALFMEQLKTLQKNLDKTKEDLDKTKQELNGKIETLTSEVQELKTKLADAEKQIIELKKEIKQKDLTINDLSTQLKSKEAELSELKKQSVAFISQSSINEQIDQENKNLKKEILDLNDKLIQEKSIVATLRETQERTNAEIEKLKAELTKKNEKASSAAPKPVFAASHIKSPVKSQQTSISQQQSKHLKPEQKPASSQKTENLEKKANTTAELLAANKKLDEEEAQEELETVLEIANEKFYERCGELIKNYGRELNEEEKLEIKKQVVEKVLGDYQIENPEAKIFQESVSLKKPKNTPGKDDCTNALMKAVMSSRRSSIKENDSSSESSDDEW